MAVFLVFLLLQMGFAVGSNYGYVEWSDQDKDLDIKGQQPLPNPHVNREQQHSPTYFTKPTTERTVVAHRIEEDLPRVVTAFLHTGDSSTLKHVNCSRRYELSSLKGRSYITSHYSLHSVLDTVAHATNFLNMILQANSSREHSLGRDILWYHALVRSILEGDPKIHRAVVTFNTESATPGPHIFLQATRTDSEIVLQDLSSTAHHRLKNKTAESEWFNEFRDKKHPHVQKRVLSQEAKASDAPLRREDRYVLDKTQIKWSAPYLECENGNFIPHWLLTLSAGFYSLKPNLAPEFRGVVRVDVNLQDVDIDQCSSNGWFAGTHRCNLTSMECKPILGHGFVLDKYKCQCKKGFYHPSRVSVNGFKRTEKNSAVSGGSHREGTWEGPSKCLPCREGCAYCRDDTPCHAQEDGSLRMAVIAFQGLCMMGDFISMVVAYHFRRNKRIRASGLILLEAIMIGALLLYFPVVILYFPPSVFRCILLRWVRLLGFAIVYGTVVLKLYRVLKVFLSRTAQRIPYMTSCRVLRLLTIILLIVCWFLVAWTSAACQNLDRDLSLIDVGVTPEGLQFSMCLLDRWDYMMAVAEFLFLLWGVYLCYAVRTVPSAFHEPRYMAVAIYNELVITAIFQVIRFTLAPALHPDWMLMLLFAHTHLTVTVTLGLLLIPKFLFGGTHTRDDIATEAYEDELDMGRSGSYLNSSITSAWSEHSLDPEDIREELKKLYAQLEIYKRKKMLANNPHLQKKRSSKKGLGRSLMRRITEIPETVSRQCSREDKDAGEHGGTRASLCALKRNHLDPSHGSKTKEDSMKNKVFSLQKSHSSYDHVRDQGEDCNGLASDKMEVSTTENSLLDALIGKKLAKEEVGEEKAEGESTESVPLVCKSASAHNLTVDKKPIHLRTSMLQKSLSVIASAKEKTLGLTGKIHGVEDGGKKGHHRGKDSKARSEVSEKPECYPKMIISQSVEYKQTASKTGIMKHQVSGSQPSICSEPGRNKDLYDLSEVCPWEVEDLPTPSEGKVQKHVSIAPGETTVVHGSAIKGKSQQKQRGMEQSPSNSRRSNQRPVERLAICPWEEEDESEGMKPQSPRNHGEKTHQKGEMRLWDTEEPLSKVPEMGLSPDRTRRKKSVTPTEGKEKVLHSDHSKSTGSLLQPPTMRVDICPWDYDGPPSPNSDKASGAAYGSASRRDSHSKRKGSSSGRTSEREKEKAKDKDDGRRRSKSKEKGSSSKSTEKRRTSQSKAAEGCPCDGGSSLGDSKSGRRKSSTSEPGSAKSKQADICPWDFEGVADSKELDKITSPAKQNALNSKTGVVGNANMADVCPWDFDDKTSGKNA
ncbi:probable G-protein coupled receptor 158 [Megalops cyprinoides]|uniref:probable G-protein coupled receptor 158 n=1 Tax=Megalops cyprinoides TaxID=118141 RepID=UPI001863B577|nr:probable G-protein coupled receptor 158 [Megalops cyprinoides]